VDNLDDVILRLLCTRAGKFSFFSEQLSRLEVFLLGFDGFLQV